ncbi:MAG: SGNH/GDSL hydrolase family protein [bacterium]|nr:SGNH/GDSL hydrolase family protein [bacterium]
MKRICTIIFIAALTVIFVSGCSVKENKSSSTQEEEKKDDDPDDEVDVDEDAIKILFIGSSYLNYNNCMGMFETLAVLAGKKCHIEREVINGYLLSHHSDSSQTTERIMKRKWDYVIMQGGCHRISKPQWHDDIIPFLRDLCIKIRNNHPESIPVFMMPWAYEDGLTWMKGEDDTYEEMQKNIYDYTIHFSKELGYAITPVGWGWYSVLTNARHHPPFYQADYNHPTPTGSYLTACVIFSTIFTESVEGIPYYGELDKETAVYMQQVASSVVMSNLETWNLTGKQGK